MAAVKCFAAASNLTSHELFVPQSLRLLSRLALLRGDLRDEGRDEKKTRVGSARDPARSAEGRARRSAGEARRERRKGAIADGTGPAANRRCVLSCAIRMATGSVRGLRGVRGERTSEGFLPPFFLFLGAILSGRWTCAGA